MNWRRKRKRRRGQRSNSKNSIVDPLQRRLTRIMMGCFVLGVVILLRSSQVQIIGDSRLADLAGRQFNAKVPLKTKRGQILDRNGEPLAVNVESMSLAANPSAIKDKVALSKKLSKAMRIPYRSILKKLSLKRGFIWVRRQISPEAVRRLRKIGIVNDSDALVKGLWLVTENKRVYPQGEVASHVLGDVNVDSKGLEGVELWLNEQLTGKGQSVRSVRDALGRPTFIDTKKARAKRDGTSIRLTLDAPLQFAVEQALLTSVEEHSARGGSVIVMNATTGEIMAMANQPSFDPNKRGTSWKSRRNRVLTDGYEPGSTMKAILMASALSHGWESSQLIWAGNGKVKIQGKVISEAEDDKKYGWLTLQKMIRVSSNVAAAKVAVQLGSLSYIETLRRLGFGKKTNMGFPGEISGWVPKIEKLEPLTLANMGFGQGLFVTPIQMTRAFAAFINGGWLVQPRLIKTELKKVRQGKPRRVFSKHVADTVVAALHEVTGPEGSGGKAKLEGFRVAGKTGTGQVVDPKTRRYSKKHYIGSFIGFAMDVEPKFVIFTAIDYPKGIYYGGYTAAPLFKKVLKAVVHKYNISPTLSPERGLARVPNDQISTTQAVGLLPSFKVPPYFFKPHAALKVVAEAPNGQKVWRIPSLKGLSPREVMKILNGNNLKVRLNGFGWVAEQLPVAGERISEGEVIHLTLREKREDRR